MDGGIQEPCWTTPVASLPAPHSYGGDDDAVTIVPRQKSSEKQQPEQGEGHEYDAGIDATYRAMEKDPMERPSADYLETTQGGKMMLADRAGLVAWMHGFARSHGLAPGALHRAVSYVDRFLSAKKLTGGERELHILGAAAVFAAAKYEDSGATWRALDADGVASGAECTRREVLDAERELVATVGYRLGGPTAYTFVEHFTRHMEKEGAAAVRSLAHRLADLALLDCRCLGFLPSAVAASAVVLAKLTLDPAAAPWSEELEVAGYYELEELAECMDAIREMYGLQGVWPGSTEMMKGWSAEATP